jgi:two-component system, NarL family, sensor histidine kinase FusK
LPLYVGDNEDILYFADVIDKKSRSSWWFNMPASSREDEMDKRYRSTPLLVIILAFVYFVAGKLGLELASINPSATAVWPPTGIALAACLLFGYRVWPGILLGAFLVNVSTSDVSATSLAIAVGNTLEGLVGAYLINRFANGRFAFNRTRDVFKFTILAGMVSTMVSATVGVTSLALSGLAAWADYLPIWLTWWLGDGTGAMIVAPPLVLWAMQPRVSWNSGRILEAVLVFLFGIAIGLAIFGGLASFGIKNLPVGFAIIPLVVWSAFRFGQTGAATLTIILSSIAIWGTLRGYGPYTRGTQNEALLLLQAFMSTVAITGLGVAGVVAERREAEDALRLSSDQLAAMAADNSRLYKEAQALNTELEARVQLRTLALEHAQAEARALNSRLLTTREEERAEMAREIHDQLGQNLTILKMDLTHIRETISPYTTDELHDRIHETFALLDELIHMVRDIAARLRPSLLDDFGLLAALEWQLQEFQTHTGITCRLDSTVENLDLKSESAIALFRVCQEALTNVARHAQATAVEITVNVLDGHLMVQIRDNGRGISDQERDNRQSLGLPGMFERVRLIGGELQIKGITGQGTTVRVNIPWGES